MASGRRRSGRRPRALALALVVLAALATPAAAHLMPHQQGTLHVVDAGVFVVLALPAAGLPAIIDDDGDGRLATDELVAHQAVIHDEVVRRVRITDGGRAGHVDYFQLSADEDERDPGSTAGSTHVLVLMKIGFAAPPAALTIAVDLWGRADADRQLTVKAARGDQIEVAVLTPRHATHRFFATPRQLAQAYVSVGAEHILGGPDHLLFLLTMVVAAAGLRYWLAVVTTFTVAHGLTITLTLLGWIHAPATLVEPTIAASIVAVALLNLRRRAATPRHRLAVVFGCGLIHGLGFAAAIGDLGVHGRTRVATIVGFNLGIELGQLIFVGGLAALGYGAQRLWRRATHASPIFGGIDLPTPTRLVSIAAALVGAWWLLARLPLG